MIELGWGRVPPGGAPLDAVSRLVALPEGEKLSRRVAEITGITDAMLREGVSPDSAFRELVATLPAAPLPTVIHYAQFEAPFLADLARTLEIAPPFDVVCVHAIARRLLPELPRRTLRALAGYFGLAVEAPRRSADHVLATAFVWRALVPLLADEGVRTWGDLRALLAAPAPRSDRRAYPMPRELRLAAPEGPGLYRMLRLDGSVLYVGKATSLRSRVNSYFRRQSGGPSHTLEMLSQAQGLSFVETATPLEAALAETDEIKLHRPQYNVALLEAGRSLWFATPDLRDAATAPDRRHRIGPLLTHAVASSLSALSDWLSRGGAPDPSRILAIPARFAPDAEVFETGMKLFLEAHPEARGASIPVLLALGARLWRDAWGEEAEADDELPDAPSVTPEIMAKAVVQRVAMAAHAVRRGYWLTALVDCAVTFTEPPASRVLVVERGEVLHRGDAPRGAPAPVPPGAARPLAERRRALTVASFDRLRILGTELKRLTAKGHPVEIRFDARRAISGDRLLRALFWI